ncbi:MAG TPA: hypothetical protein VN903_16150 [Polyangia bacterium]|jgi:hypothetical protein|nr:hypothetical protein [Polyangia bacterium]
MKKKIKLANRANEWSLVLEQPFVQDIVDRLATKRSWEIEDRVEADEAGWSAIAREGDTLYILSLTVPGKMADSQPPPVIEWTLEADVDRHEKQYAKRTALAVIMFGMGALFAWLGFRLGVPFALLPILGALGIFPIGLFLAVWLSHVLTKRRKPEPIAGRAEFLKEVAAALAQLPTAP